MVLELAGVIAYLLILVAIGVVASRRMKDVRDYYAAGKRLSFISAAFSARATGESAWLLLGLTGMGALVGVQAFWVVLGEILGVGAAWIIMCRRFRHLTGRYDSITIPDYLESRFRDHGHLLRLVAAGALVVFVTIYVSAQIFATGNAFSSFLGLNYYLGACIGFGVVMVYIVTGGFLAVVWSDVFQGAMMVIGLVVLPIAGFAAAGGIGVVFDGLRAQDAGLLSPWGPDGWTSLTVFQVLSLALIGLGFLGSPQIFVRFLALRSEKEIPRGTFVALSWTLLADCGAVLTGLVGRHLLVGPGQEVETVLGAGAEETLPMLVRGQFAPVIVGLFIAVVLAAIMSTVDSLLIVASSAYVRDYYQKVRHPDLPDDTLVGLSRRTTVIIALVALAVAISVALITDQGTIFWFVIFGWSGIAATFCPTIVLSLFWKGITARGALAAMITGFVCVPLFKFAAPHLPVVGDALGALGELPSSFFLSGAAGVTVSLLDPHGRARLADVGEELECR